MTICLFLVLLAMFIHALLVVRDLLKLLGMPYVAGILFTAGVRLLVMGVLAEVVVGMLLVLVEIQVVAGFLLARGVFLVVVIVLAAAVLGMLLVLVGMQVVAGFLLAVGCGSASTSSDSISGVSTAAGRGSGASDGS